MAAAATARSEHYKPQREVDDLGLILRARNGDRIALMNVNWGSARPTIGTGARASVTVLQKDNALIVPLRAIKAAGNKQFVETLDGATRKSNPVEVGIISGTDAEILNGAQEGQNLVLESSTDAAKPISTTLAAVPTLAPTAAPAALSPSAAENATPAGVLLDESFADNRHD